MSHLWNKVQDEMADEKPFTKKKPKVPRSFMGFSNRAQRFTGSNYLDVDSPFQI